MKTEVQLTSKFITIEDLKNTDHVGWIDTTGRKCLVVATEDGYYSVGESCDYNCNLQYGKPSNTIREHFKTIKTNCNQFAQIEKLYRFDTRKELYQWLAE